MAEWVLEFDGLFEPRMRPWGIATYGFVARHGGELVHEGKGVVAAPWSGGSANVAEFGALLAGLLWLEGQDVAGCPLRITGDSRLAIETVAGRWSLTSERLLPLRDAARGILARLEVSSLEMEKVPRERNADADRLTREAYREALAEHPEWREARKRPPEGEGARAEG